MPPLHLVESDNLCFQVGLNRGLCLKTTFFQLDEQQYTCQMYCAATHEAVLIKNQVKCFFLFFWFLFFVFNLLWLTQVQRALSGWLLSAAPTPLIMFGQVFDPRLIFGSSFISSLTDKR